MSTMLSPDEMTDEQRAGWDEWVASRPERVRTLIEQLPPWQYWKIKDTGHKCSILSYDEPVDPAAPVTVKVYVAPDQVRPQLAAMFPDTARDGYAVFGLGPETLEPWVEPEPPAA